MRTIIRNLRIGENEALLISLLTKNISENISVDIHCQLQLLFQIHLVVLFVFYSAHWFLAVVCFPGLEKPKYEPNPHYHENAVIQKNSTAEDSCGPPSASEMDSCSQTAAKPVIKKVLTRKHCFTVTDSSAGQEQSDPCDQRNMCIVKKINHIASENEESNKGESSCQKVVDRTKSENGLQDECFNSVHHPGMYSCVLKDKLN